MASIRRLALVSACLLASAANAQTTANRNGAALLSPFEGLNAFPLTLAQNLQGAVAINNNATAAQRAQAVSDNTITSRDASNLADGLGGRLNTAYQASVPKLASSAPLIQLLTQANALSGADSSYGKAFFGNGTSNGTTPVTGAGANPNPDVYGKAYLTPAQAAAYRYGDPRPFQVSSAVQQYAPASVYSGLTTSPAFPSGHTTYGYTEALLLAEMVPERFTQELTRASEYGYSRVVLGVHYPLDVIAGRILATYDVAQLLNNAPGYAGASVGGTAVASDYAALFGQASSQLRTALASGCGGSVAACAVSTGNDRFGSPAANLADWEYRLDYGLASTGDTTLAPVVPTGAEVLLATRFPYLTADQRRDVLGSTELPSGFALDNGSGWARLDLYRAGLGPAAFASLSTIVQDGTLGGFAAADTWSNDIAGPGGFMHLGSGALTLAGNNSYSGGTILGGGTVIAAALTALGRGDVTVANGTLQVTAPRLLIGGNYTQGTTGVLSLAALGQFDIVDILGRATLAGLLQLDLGAFGNVNGIYQLLGWNSFAGQFDGTSFAGLGSGVQTRLDYRGNGLFLTLSGAVPEPAAWWTMLAGFGVVGTALRRSRRQRAAA